MELGAAWAQGSKNLAIVVPPTDYDDVTKTLGLKQAWKITDRSGLVDLRQVVVDTISNLEKRSEHTWDDKRTKWKIALKKQLPLVQQPTKIDADKHQEVLDELREKSKEIDQLETSLDTMQENYAELEKLKNKEDVKQLKKRNSAAQALQEEFDELIEAVSTSKPKVSNLVVKHLILDHFDMAGKIDWFNDRSEFEQAVKYGLISHDDDTVRWSRDKLKPFKKAIQAVQDFLASEDGGELRKNQEAGIPMEPDDLEFWEYHLGI